MLLSLVFSSLALAMPCDTGYTCTSASGRYKIEIQRCRYDNRLGNFSLLLNKSEVTNATGGPAWDGDQFGAFEIDLATQGDTQRMLSVEFSKKTMKGVIYDKSRAYNPGPWKTTRHEAISCVDEG